MSNTDRKIQILDFEKPIYEMQKKIEELKNASSTTQINYDSGIESLEEQTKMYKKELYEKLEPYQKLQIARLTRDTAFRLRFRKNAIAQYTFLFRQGPNLLTPP